MVEAENAILLFLPDDANGIVHHAHNVGMELRCLRENIVDSVWVEVFMRREISSGGVAVSLMWTSPIVLDRARLAR